jgi:hypothetical protein
MPQVDEVVLDIQGIRSKIYSGRLWDRPSELSTLGIRLSADAHFLAEHVAEAKADYEQARASKYLSHLNGGKSASNAENLARSESVEERVARDKLELLLKATWNLQSMIQSRLKDAGSEKTSL